MAGTSTILKKLEKALKNNVQKDIDTINTFLIDVITGKKTDEIVVHKTGEVVAIEAPNAVKIQAAKVWKELNVDKVVGDAKEMKKDKTPDAEKISNAVKDVARKKREEAEKKARETGKVVDMQGKK